MTSCTASAEGGVGKSAGRCGKSEGMSSGCDVNRGSRFAGVRISCSKKSSGRSQFCSRHRAIDNIPGLALLAAPIDAMMSRNCDISSALGVWPLAAAG